MRVGSFILDDELPELKEPHALVVLRPWIDAGDAGTLALERLEAKLGAKELGKLARPGNFFDFTRYRPNMYMKDGVRELAIPNTRVSFAKRNTGNDLVFIHLLEPHMFAEVYVNSVELLLEKLGIRRYSLMGSMYDMVPHTRPLLISGGGFGKQVMQDLKNVGIQTSNYVGPTTICNLISQHASRTGIETMSLLVHLPQYTDLDEDYLGELALLRVIDTIYGIPVEEADIRQAEGQLKDIETAILNDPKLKVVITELENLYDSRAEARKAEEPLNLSPDVEKFLKEMENRFKQD